MKYVMSNIGGHVVQGQVVIWYVCLGRSSRLMCRNAVSLVGQKQVLSAHRVLFGGFSRSQSVCQFDGHQFLLSVCARDSPGMPGEPSHLKSDFQTSCEKSHGSSLVCPARSKFVWMVPCRHGMQTDQTQSSEVLFVVTFSPAC